MLADHTHVLPLNSHEPPEPSTLTPSEAREAKRPLSRPIPAKPERVAPSVRRSPNAH